MTNPIQTIKDLTQSALGDINAAATLADLAALPEMFESGGASLIRGEGNPLGWNLEPGYQRRFVDQAVEALRSPFQESTRRALRHSATKRFGWGQCLDAWERLLQK